MTGIDRRGRIGFTPETLAQEAMTLQPKLRAGLSTLREVDDVDYGATDEGGSLARRQGRAVSLHAASRRRPRRCRC